MIRDFERSDQDAIRSLVLDGMRERWGEEFDASANSDLDDIFQTYVASGAEVAVLELGGRLVACGTLLSETSERGRIVRVSVHHEHRRQGLGRQIVDHLVARARRRGMSEVVVATDTPWASAVALYVACGFIEVARDGSETHLLKRW